jgi:hypothetical protein
LPQLPSTREHEACRIEFCLACAQIVDHAIAAPIEPVAGREERTGEQLLIGFRKCRIQDRIAVKLFLYRLRRDGLDRFDAPDLAQLDRFEIVEGIADDDAVMVVGKVL